MTLNFCSLLVTNSEEAEAFLEFNSNILETNLINLLILFGILLYANKTTFSKNLKRRQETIVQTIENAQNDVVKASNYYYLAEKGYSQSLFWLQSWKSFYEKEKLDIVNNKYKVVKSGLLETFATSEKLITNFETKAFLSLQRYIIYMTATRILRKFLSLSDIEQSKLIEVTIAKLGGSNK